MHRSTLDAASRGLLFLTAFVAGFAVTGIEIALGRLLAPHFGASLTVWASVIAAVVAALAIGYPLGGYLADRRPGVMLPLVATLLGQPRSVPILGRANSRRKRVLVGVGA